MRRLSIFLIITTLLAACNAAPAATSVPPTAAQAAFNAPAWVAMPFTDVRANKPTTLADYAGKTIYVEAMAAWCTNCKAQQGRLKQARAKLASDKVVFLSLDIDPNENAVQLAQYTVDQGFDWNFGLSNNDLTSKLIDQFGRTITNPPSTPSFIISPNGKVSELYTGNHSPDELIALIQQASA